MLHFIQQIKNVIPLDIFTSSDLSTVLGSNSTNNSRHSRVKRALRAGHLIQIKKGLYALSPKLRRTRLNNFSIAQRVYGPSYVSLESALSYHGLIPEAVYSVTSVSTKRAREFDTPITVFSYKTIPHQAFPFEIMRVGSELDLFLIATPEKALLDYIYVYKKNISSLHALEADLRIEPDIFFNPKTLKSLIELAPKYQSHRVLSFVEAIVQEVRTKQGREARGEIRK